MLPLRALVAAATLLFAPYAHAATRTFDAVITGLRDDFGAFAMLGFDAINPAPDEISFRFSYDDAILSRDVTITSGGVATARSYSRPSTLLSLTIGDLTLLTGTPAQRFNQITILDQLTGTPPGGQESLSYVYDGGPSYPLLSNGIILDRMNFTKAIRSDPGVFSGPDAFTADNLDALPEFVFNFTFRNGAETAFISHQIHGLTSSLAITEVSAVPLPLSGLMLLGGLASFAGLRRRWRQ